MSVTKNGKELVEDLRYVAGGILIVVLVLAWFFRTWFQPLVMWIYTTPSLLQAALIWALLHQVINRVVKRSMTIHYQSTKKQRLTTSIRLAPILSALLLVALLVALPVMASMARQVHIAEMLEYTPRDSLPEASQQLRLMPFEVARRYAADSLQLSQYRLGTEHVALIDGRLSYMFPLIPDGLILSFTLRNHGITYVDATRQERNSVLVADQMALGEGNRLVHNLWWNLYRHRYLVHTGDPYYLPAAGQIQTIVPAIGYTHHLRWGLWYTVPRLEGLFMVSPQGDIRLLSHQEALGDPALADNVVFPEELARTYVSAYQYHLGVMNRLFVHQDQIQIQDVGANRQPFLMDTEDGLKWFISAEPYGASHGVFKIFLVDARTGLIEMFELPSDQVLTGPVRSMDYVRRSNPVVDWNRFIMAEPLPFVRDGILYWKIAVIPDDAAGIAYQAFVDSRTNDVYEMGQDEQIRAFIRGGETALPDPGDDLQQRLRELLRDLEEILRELEQTRH